jgi:hypothetical protein
MELDDMKTAWAAHGAALERSLRINERLLREMMVRKARFALAPYVVWRALEVVLGGAALVFVVRVLAAHIGEPRYLVVVGALALLTAGITALCAYLLVGALALDHGGPVTAMQRHVEQLKLVEYHALKWVLLGGVLMWLPAVLVLLEVLSGFDALARVNLRWLLSNLAFGVVVVVAGQLWSRRHVERPGRGPRAQRIVDALSGRELRKAAAHLAELASFERDEAP